MRTPAAADERNILYMNTVKRKTVIAGNWKMNKTPSQTAEFIKQLVPAAADAACGVVVAVPFVCLPAAVQAVKGSAIKVAAQNVHFEDQGAYTGEVSADMLLDLGVEYVIIGHSERRQYFAETDQTVNKKVLKALQKGLKPIICVGESLEQREAGVTEEFVAMQTKEALLGVPAADIDKVIIAYEPIWAIGTGRTATADQADEVNGLIRRTVAGLYGEAAAEAMTVQYGGSMNANNAAELLGKDNVDGGLIGGASLKADDFRVIIEAARQ